MATWTKRPDGKWESDAGDVADSTKAAQLETKAKTAQPKKSGLLLTAQEKRKELEALPGQLNQFLWGFNEPVAKLLDTVTAPFQDNRPTLSSLITGEQKQPFFQRHMVGPQPTDALGRVSRSGGAGLFNAAATLAPQLRAAQMGALAAPVTSQTGTAARIGKSILDQTRAAPGAISAIEAGAGAAGGMGAQAATEAFPDSPIAPVIGGLLGAAAPAAMGARALRGAIEPVLRQKVTQPPQSPKAGVIRKEAAALEENAKPDIVAPERPSVAMQKEVADAAHDLLTVGGVPRDKSLKLYEQVADLLESGRLSTPQIREILATRGVMAEDFANKLYGQTISQAGRELQVLSNLAQRLAKVETADQALIGDTRTTIQRLDDIRRGLLVSQLGTAVRNATVGGGRSIYEVFNRGLEFGLQAARGQVNPNNPVQTPAQIWSGFARLFTFKDNLDITKKVLEIRPKLYDQLMRQYSADRALGVTGKMDKVVDALNIFNRTQDQFFRTAVFADSLERRLAVSGLDMREIMKSGNAGQIPRETIEASVNDALEFTFSDDVKTQGGRAFVNFVETFRPLTTVVMPFPRFFANSLRFMTENSTVGPLWLLRAEERAALKAGDNKLISRALLGSAMTYAGYAIRDSESAGEKWYEIRSDDGRTIDMRPYYPAAAYLFVGDLIKRANDGTMFGMTAKDLLQGVSGAQVRGGTGLYMVDGFINDISGDALAGKKAWNIAKRLAGEYSAGYLIPFQQVKDAYSQFDKEDRIIKDVASDPFTGPLLTKLPGASQSLPAAESPTRGADIMRQDPLFRQLTGINYNAEKNPAEKEFDRLGYKRVEIYRNTGIPEADRLILKHMGPLVENVISRLVESPMYQSLGALENNGGPPAQRYMLDQFMGYVREVARLQATAENPVLMARVKYNSSVDKDLRIMLERVYGINAESIGEQ